MKPLLKQYGVKPTEYEGPASFATMLLAEAQRHNVEMLSIAAEIPGYLQGTNPRSIEAVARRLAKMINQPIDVDSLREASNEWEAHVSAAVEKDEELAATIRKLEEEYDDALIQSEAS
jgi:proteasome assembly chaperone (PAC2) family protein